MYPTGHDVTADSLVVRTPPGRRYRVSRTGIARSSDLPLRTRSRVRVFPLDFRSSSSLGIPACSHICHTGCRQLGHLPERRNHLSTQDEWKQCSHRGMRASCTRAHRLLRQMAHTHSASGSSMPSDDPPTKRITLCLRRSSSAFSFPSSGCGRGCTGTDGRRDATLMLICMPVIDTGAAATQPLRLLLVRSIIGPVVVPSPRPRELSPNTEKASEAVP